jgi:hypothetical protein
LHSQELYGLLALCTLVTGVYAWWHARRYWEGLPPLLDAFVSMAGYLAVIGAIVAGARIGPFVQHPHAGRVILVMAALLAVRIARTWLGREQERYRKARAKRTVDEGE